MAEIGVHVLVETPQRIVVIAGLPDREMEDAQQLQRLAQRPGAARTHGLEHLGRIRLPRFAGMGGVTPRKLLHGLDAERHRPQEDTLFLVERIVRQAGSDFPPPGAKAPGATELFFPALITPCCGRKRFAEFLAWFLDQCR